MKKGLISFVVVILLFTMPYRCFAWGKRGHQIVAQIAYHFLDDSTRQKVQKYLGKMSFEDAATWMDDMRSNDYYSYMRMWHFINIDKGQQYQPAAVRNLITVLKSA